MAVTGIVVQTETPNKPEVINLALSLGIEPDAVIGKLVRFWLWYERHGPATPEDPVARRLTRPMIDKLVDVPGFAASMVACGWLVSEGAHVTVPALITASDLQATPKKRAAKRKTAEPPPLDEIMAAFEQCVGMTGLQWTDARRKSVTQRWKTPHFRDNWRAGIHRAAMTPFLLGKGPRKWTMTLDFFLKPDTLVNILEGKYDGGTESSEERRESTNQDAFGLFESIDGGRGNHTGTETVVFNEGPRRIDATPGRNVGGSPDRVA